MKLELQDILLLLPHRDPFLLLDRILEINPPSPDWKSLEGTQVIAEKVITPDEPCFKGHFPNNPIYPGVLVIEAMGQTACFSLLPEYDFDVQKLTGRFHVALAGVDQARFRKPVKPGDRLILKTVVDRIRGKLWFFSAQAWVKDELVAEAKLIASLMLQEEGSA